MPIFDEYKTVFVHIPKTAGTSVMTMLSDDVNQYIGNPNKISLKYMYGKNLQHLTGTKLRLLAPFRFRRYYRFAFVRNPWDRMVSEFKWRSKWDEGLKDKDLSYMLQRVELYRKKRAAPHFLEAADFVFDGKGKLLVDYVGRFESIEEDFKSIAAAIGIDKELPKTNVSGGASKGYRDWYTPETVTLIEKLFCRDIEAFDYKF